MYRCVCSRSSTSSFTKLQLKDLHRTTPINAVWMFCNRLHLLSKVQNQQCPLSLYVVIQFTFSQKLKKAVSELVVRLFKTLSNQLSIDPIKTSSFLSPMIGLGIHSLVLTLLIFYMTSFTGKSSKATVSVIQFTFSQKLKRADSGLVLRLIKTLSNQLIIDQIKASSFLSSLMQIGLGINSTYP